MHYKRIIQIFFLNLILIFASGCKSTPAQIDYDTQTNFSQFKSFEFQQLAINTSSVRKSDENMVSATVTGSESSHIATSPEITDRLTFDRIKQAISTNLQSKSMALMASDAQLQIQFYTFNQIKNSSSSVSLGVGGASHSGHSSTGISLGTMFGIGDDKLFTEITIDMHHQGKLIWRGRGGFTASTDINPTKKTQLIDSAVKDILSKYPPKG